MCGLMMFPNMYTPLMYDYDNFHQGKDTSTSTNGTSTTKNVLFADGHVRPL
jgi:prepilin-type processing-associated H-X9-DG protein